MDINKIKSEGFLLKEFSKKDENVAFISLKLSLKSFFSTYYSFTRKMHYITDAIEKKEEYEEEYTKSYIENCCEAILHFHHFVELIFKDILYREHPLLAVDASQKPEILHKLLNNQKIEDREYENLKLLNFSIVLERIKELIDKKLINQSKYQFISDATTWLKILNNLRNRITHRGTYILRYKSLDYLFGKYALPFLINIINLDEYQNRENFWKYEKPFLKTDPIEEIIRTINKNKYDIYKIALLKEIGRAAYTNPIKIVKGFGNILSKDDIRRFELFADTTLKIDNIEDVKKCPVCGIKSLVLFYDFFDEVNDCNQLVSSDSFVYRVRCYCCTFDINHEIFEIDKMNIGIENYWKERL